MSTMWQGCLADTDYFELRSGGGHDYGVWVTTPPGYDPATTRAPAVYVLDGNWAVGMTAPLIVTQKDPMQQIRPYIQVSVGYAGEDAQHWARLRNRDLVPPGEPIAPEFVDAVETGIRAGAMTREEADAYLAELKETHADAVSGLPHRGTAPADRTRLRHRRERSRPLRLLLRRALQPLRLAHRQHALREHRSGQPRCRR